MTPHKTKSTTRNGWKTCSRGHSYRGEACPVCWPGRTLSKTTARKSAKTAKR